MDEKSLKATDEILLARPRSCPTDPAISEKLERGEFIKTENGGKFLPNWAKLPLSIIAVITIIAIIARVGTLFFISPIAALVVVAAIVVCLIMFGDIADGP